MQHLVKTFALISTLLLLQSCSSSIKSGENANSQTMGTDSHPEHSHSTPDEHNSEQTKALFSERQNIKPKQPVSLAILIQDSQGKAITKFDKFQEELIHLIVVNDNLEYFNHLHPTYKQNGRFEVKTSFPAAGKYTFFADYKPTGKTEQVSVLQEQVPGVSPTAPPIDVNTAKTFGNTMVNITFDQPRLKAGEATTVVFNLRNTANSQPVTDLKPYLGEKGHLVIIKQSSPLTKADYIHAHAIKDSPDGQVKFMTKFPKPGKYKMWGQFNRNGKIVTANFWVNVE